MPKPTITPRHVLLADDQPVVRCGLRSLLLSRIPSLNVDECGDHDSLRHRLETTKPDLVVTELMLNDRGVLDLVRFFVEQQQGSRIMIFSASPANVYARWMMRSGCSGYLMKSSPEHVIVATIERLLPGANGPDVPLNELLDRTEHAHNAPDPADPFDGLSDQELRVMAKLSRGMSIKEISQTLDLSPSTVATYKTRLFNKLGITTLIDLQQLVGLFPLDRRPH